MLLKEISSIKVDITPWQTTLSKVVEEARTKIREELGFIPKELPSLLKVINVRKVKEHLEEIREVITRNLETSVQAVESLTRKEIVQAEKELKKVRRLFRENIDQALPIKERVLSDLEKLRRKVLRKERVLAEHLRADEAAIYKELQKARRTVAEELRHITKISERDLRKTTKVAGADLQRFEKDIKKTERLLGRITHVDISPLKSSFLATLHDALAIIKRRYTVVRKNAVSLTKSLKAEKVVLKHAKTFTNKLRDYAEEELLVGRKLAEKELRQVRRELALAEQPLHKKIFGSERFEEMMRASGQDALGKIKRQVAITATRFAIFLHKFRFNILLTEKMIGRKESAKRKGKGGRYHG